jgi:hypothetical protein
MLPVRYIYFSCQCRRGCRRYLKYLYLSLEGLLIMSSKNEQHLHILFLCIGGGTWVILIFSRMCLARIALR